VKTTVTLLEEMRVASCGDSGHEVYMVRSKGGRERFRGETA
jgi:hypothetical protein